MRQTRQVVQRRARPVLTHPLYSVPRRRSPLAAILAVLGFLAACVLLGAAAALYWSLHQPQSSSRRTVSVHVGTGDTVNRIADSLQRHGIINNSLLFRLDARLHSLGSRLKVGDYQLRRNMSIDQMVGVLLLYRAQEISVTVPEGLRSEQIAAILRRHGIDPSSFLREVAHPTDLAGLPILADKPAWAGLEGYLFPNTYDVPPRFSGRAFARLMVHTLDKRFTPALRAEVARDGMGIYRTLTLASIVEREAKVPDERRLIAGVYMNRIRAHWDLNADPTIQYAVGHAGDWWPILTDAQLHVPSPYNTYLHQGLPPGPIANAGMASIMASVYPAHTRYWFFVAKGGGRHAFAVTLAQQLANQQKYQGQP